MAILGLGLLGLTTRAVGSAEALYRRLKQPIRLSLQDFKTSWQTQAFDAYCCAAGNDAATLLRGILVQLPPVNGQRCFKAFCRLCPHEMCYVDFTADPDRIPQNVTPRPDHPMFVCPCHLSVFDADGEPLSGPATRGLFQFRLTVDADRITITEVEEEVLWWLKE